MCGLCLWLVYDVFSPFYLDFFYPSLFNFYFLPLVGGCVIFHFTSQVDFHHPSKGLLFISTAIYYLFLLHKSLTRAKHTPVN